MKESRSRLKEPLVARMLVPDSTAQFNQLCFPPRYLLHPAGDSHMVCAKIPQCYSGQQLTKGCMTKCTVSRLKEHVRNHS